MNEAALQERKLVVGWVGIARSFIGVRIAYRFEDPLLSGVPFLPLPPQLLHVLWKHKRLGDKVTLLWRESERAEVKEKKFNSRG